MLLILPVHVEAALILITIISPLSIPKDAPVVHVTVTVELPAVLFTDAGLAPTSAGTLVVCAANGLNNPNLTFVDLITAHSNTITFEEGAGFVWLPEVLNVVTEESFAIEKINLSNDETLLDLNFL